MGNFGNLNSFHRNFSFSKSKHAIQKLQSLKQRYHFFGAEQTVHWSTHRLVVAVACLRTVKKVENPHSISLEDTQNRIMRKFRHFNIRNQNVIVL